METFFQANECFSLIFLQAFCCIIMFLQEKLLQLSFKSMTSLNIFFEIIKSTKVLTGESLSYSSVISWQRIVLASPVVK